VALPRARSQWSQGNRSLHRVSLRLDTGGESFPENVQLSLLRGRPLLHRLLLLPGRLPRRLLLVLAALPATLDYARHGSLAR